MTTIGNNEFVFYKDTEGDIYSGGFQVNSLLMKQGFSPIMTLNRGDQMGGTNGMGSTNEMGGTNVSDLFHNLVVPNWALAFPFKQSGGKSTIKKEEQYENSDKEEEEVLDEDIHSKLLGMLTVNPSEMKKSSHKGTRKLLFHKTKNMKNSKNTGTTKKNKNTTK
jgi:hypothetical protein